MQNPDLVNAALLSWAMPETLTVSEWAASKRVLRGDYSREPGLWQAERTPYVIEPMNRLGITDPCRELVTVFPSQTGKTTIAENWLGYIVDISPGPVMMATPTDDDAADWVDSRIQPMIDDCAALKAKFDTPFQTGSVVTKLKKAFRGGLVYFKGTNSSSKSRAKAIRFLNLDEIDAFKTNVGRDGNPLKLFMARTTTYGRQAKIHFSSTPTEELTSRIWQEYLASDQHRFFVVLPCCGVRQQLEFRHLRPGNKNPTGHVVYQCPFCEAYVEEREKNNFLATGAWAPWIEQVEEREAVLEQLGDADVSWETTQTPIWRAKSARTSGRRQGYHINGLYSPYGWLSWQQIWDEFEAARGDPESLQAWTNTRMAEVWTGIKGDRVDDDALGALVVPYSRPVPDGVLHLTAGIDTQDDRIELLIAGWGDNGAAYHVDHKVIFGDPEADDVWEEVGRVLADDYDGFNIGCTCVDSGGHHTDRVYMFCKSRTRQRIFAIKGSSTQTAPIWPVNSTVIKRLAVRMFVVGVHKAKYAIFQKLQKKPDDVGRFYFPDSWTDEYREEYFSQLTAEQMTRYRKAGTFETRFEKLRERNEVLDLWVYAYTAHVALRHFGMQNRPRINREVVVVAPVVKVRENKFMARERRGWFK